MGLSPPCPTTTNNTMPLALSTFVQEWNNDTLSLEIHKLPTDPFLPVDQPVYQAAQPTYGIRPSSLGQPAIISAFSALLKHLGANKPQQPTLAVPYGRRADIFVTGHAVEARLLRVLQDYGFDVAQHVPSVHNGIHGTCDCILDGTYLIDVKTAGSGNFKRYTKDGLPLKYVTQLAVYEAGLAPEWGRLECSVLIYNKDTSELATIRPTTRELGTSLQRVRDIVDGIRDCTDHYDFTKDLTKTVDMLLDTFKPLVAVPQISGGEPTGNLLVPLDAQYNPWYVDLMYATYTGTNTRNHPTRYITNELSTTDIVNNIKELLS